MEQYDVVVVGAGPAGSSAARFSSEYGAKTLFMDHRKEIGVPVQCGEFLPTFEEMKTMFPPGEYLKEAYDIPSHTIESYTNIISLISPKGKKYEIPFKGVSVDRTIFDKELAYRAERAGAEFLEKTGCIGVHKDVVKTTKGDIKAKVIIGADGPLSIVAKSKGVSLKRTLYKMITANSYGNFGNKIDMYFGDYIYGGYGWVISKSKGANVGLGVSKLKDNQNLSTLLKNFLNKININEYHNKVTWVVPIGPPPETLVYGNTLLVGDAGNMVMATNGGGIPTAMIGGRDAGVAAASYVRGDKKIGYYDELWKNHLWDILNVSYKTKALSDYFFWNNTLLEFSMNFLGQKRLERVIRCQYPFKVRL